MEEKIDIKDIYSSLIQLTIHAESITWERFNSFLIGNSIFILAWVQLFIAIPVDLGLKKFILSIMCSIGMVGSAIFLYLADRGRAFLNKYIEIGSYIENDPGLWPQEINHEFKPFSKTKNLRDLLPYSCAGSRAVLRGGSALFLFFYLALLIISLIS